MSTVTVYTSKDASALDGTIYNWSGTDLHHPVGRSVGNLFTFRSVIYFPISFSGMNSITSAIMWLRGSKSGASHCFGDSSSKTMYVRRQGKTWIEDTATSENTWTNRTNDFTTLSGATTTHQATKAFSSGITDGTWYSVDITAIVQDWKNGSANYGVVLINSTETNDNDGVEFYSREKGSAYRPYVIITYNSNLAPNAPSSLSPTGDAVVSSITPFVTGAFTDPDAGDTISGYQVEFYEDDGTTLKWDTGTIATTTTPFSKQYAGPALSFATFYKWKARTKDSKGAWGPYSSLQRFQTVDPVDATPPDPIDGLSASPTDSTIVLNWTISAELEVDFDHYEIYRRLPSETDWVIIGSVYDINTPTFEDVTPQFGVTYEYKVTQFKNVDGGFDIESADSDLVDAQVVSDARDAWTVFGADGSEDHIFDLPVTGNPIHRPIQQEEFEPLGSNRKTIVRGKVLGQEGVIDAQWDVSERETAIAQIEYIVKNRGPHVLRSPFGDVWLVEFSGEDREDLPAGHLKISIPWTEVA